MNTPAPNIPITPPAATPQTAPTLWGVSQSLLTGYLAFKASQTLGLSPEYATMIAAGVASSLTSALHAWAQKIHLAS